MLIPFVGTRYEKSQVPEWLTILGTGGYVKFKEYRLTYCEGRHSLNIGDRLSGCGAKISFPNRSSENFITCPECNNDYRFEELIGESTYFKELVDINYEKIINDILLKIREANCEVSGIEGNKNCYVLRAMEREYLMVFDGNHSDPRSIESDEGILNINILSGLRKEVLPDTVINILGLNILQYGFEGETYRLRDLPTSKVLISRLQRIAEVEDSIIEKSKELTWQAIENELSNFFLEQIRSKSVELYEYKLLSEAYPRFSNVPVNAAGAGNADKITIPLANYLAEIFDGTFTVDAKCYTSTAVSSKAIETVQHHLSKDGFDARRIVIIATTNNVTCWDDVINYKRTTGQYRLLIFNARLMAEVAVQLNFDEKFLEVLDQCINVAQG